MGDLRTLFSKFSKMELDLSFHLFLITIFILFLLSYNSVQAGSNDFYQSYWFSSSVESCRTPYNLDYCKEMSSRSCMHPKESKLSIGHLLFDHLSVESGHLLCEEPVAFEKRQQES